MSGNVPRTFRKPKGPCLDCADRCVGCHSECEKYISWKEEYGKAKREYKEAIETDRILDQRVIEGTQRYKKCKPMR
jgi:hypothetical protein